MLNIIQFISQKDMSESHRNIEDVSIASIDADNYESELPSNLKRKKTVKHEQKINLVKLIGIILILFGVIYAFISFNKLKNQAQNISRKIDKLSNQLTLEKTNSQKQIHSLSPIPIQNSPKQPQILSSPPITNKNWLPSTGKLGANSKIIQKGGTIKRAKGTVCEIEELKKDQQGRSIEEVLYSKELIQSRVNFIKRRNEVVDQKKAQFPQFGLTKYNLKLTKQALEEDRKLHQAQYERVNKIHNFDQFDTELPICIIVPGYNNNDKFRLESNLNSLFTQNYTNYFVAILDDASIDKSNEVFANYFNFYDINPHRYVYLKNQRRLTALQNIYYTVHNICSEDSVSMIVDGDDELIGKNALKIFNIGYLRNKGGVVYSNFYFYNQDKGAISIGFTTPYTDEQKNNNRYRQITPSKYSQLRSFKTSIFRKIQVKDLQQQNGSFYKVDYDLAIFLPSMELACTKVFKVDGVHYLYNINTGINDFAVNNREGARIQTRIRQSKKYTCDNDFKEFISKN